MQLKDSTHWKRKRRYRPDITDDLIEYAIENSNELKDGHWEDALNAVCRVPPSGRILKVVYKKDEDKIKIITAFWLD